MHVPRLPWGHGDTLDSTVCSRDLYLARIASTPVWYDITGVARTRGPLKAEAQINHHIVECRCMDVGAMTLFLPSGIQDSGHAQLASCTVSTLIAGNRRFKSYYLMQRPQNTHPQLAEMRRAQQAA